MSVGSPTLGYREAVVRRLSTGWLTAPLGMLLLFAATGGPDCLRYLDWSRVFREGQILALGGRALSPLGLPFSQWSHGPGLLFALPRLVPWPHALIPATAFGPIDDFRGLGWLAALALWWSLHRTVSYLSGGSRPITWFLLGAAFIGTHLGFYSFQHASESLALGTLSLLIYWLVVPRTWRTIDVLFVGTLCGLLLLIRSQLLLYAVPALLVLGWRLRRTSQAGPLHATVAILPFLIAAIQVSWVNRWMTGSVFGSAYEFGDGAFRSLDWTRPELFAVLFHPWHGLLVYHPIYAVGFAGLLYVAWRSTDVAPRALLIGIVLIVLLHVYLQAAWYCWWMGVGTFGQRGLGTVALFVVPILAYLLRERPDRERQRRLLFGAVAVTSIWSFVLLSGGMTNFYSFRELFEAQARSLVEPSVTFALIVTPLLALAVGWRPRAGGARLRTFGAVLFVSLAAYALAEAATFRFDGAIWAPLMAPVIAVLVAILVGRLADQGTNPAEPVGSARPFERGVVLTVVLIFLVSGVLFGRLAIRTEHHIFDSRATRAASSARGVDLLEVRETYDEYRRVEGFEKKKAALAGFIQRAGREE